MSTKVIAAPGKSVTHNRRTVVDLAARFSELETLARTSAPGLVDEIRALVPPTDRPTRVTFAGCFNAGKSTLINALIGKMLLSSGDLPETGVLCELREGELTGALLKLRDGSAHVVPANPDGIRQAVGRYLDDGRPNHALPSAIKVELTIEHPPFGRFVTWVDTPGIDDSRDLEQLLRDELRQTDLLVWVLPSRQLLSMTEATFLAEFMTAHGPDALVLALNAFLPADTPEMWHEFLVRLPDYRARLEEGWQGLGHADAPLPPVVPVSARAALFGDRALFGVDALRELINERSDPSHPARLRHAYYAAGKELEALARGRIAELCAECKHELAREETAVVAKNRARKLTKQYNSDMRAAIDRFVDRATAAVGAAKPASLTEQQLRNPKSVLAAQHDAAMTAILREADMLVKEVADAAHVAGVDPKPVTAASLVDLLKLPAADSVPAPPTDDAGGDLAKSVGGGAAAGFAAGVVLPVIGNAAGAAVGAAWGFLNWWTKTPMASPAAVTEAVNTLANRLTDAVSSGRPALIKALSVTIPRSASVTPSVRQQLSDVEALRSAALSLAADLSVLARSGRQS